MDNGKRLIFQKNVIKKPGSTTVKTIRPKPIISNIFEDENDDDDNNQKNIISYNEKITTQSFGSSITIRRSVKELNKALLEDSKVFEYDDVYDDMVAKKSTNNSSQIGGGVCGDKEQPRYMEAILEAAAFRKRENDRRMERKIQKERELDNPELLDKEAFVTETYRKKLEERLEEDELLRQKEEFDKTHAADKQTNMSQFYRHLIINQRMVCDDELISNDNYTFTQKTRKKMNLRERNTNENNEDDEPNDNINTCEIDYESCENNNTTPNIVSNDTNAKSENEESKNTSTTLGDDQNQTIHSDAEGECTDEPIRMPKSLGIHIYDRRNTEEDINKAKLRFLERKSTNLLQHYLMAGIVDDD